MSAENCELPAQLAHIPSMKAYLIALQFEIGLKTVTFTYNSVITIDYKRQLLYPTAASSGQSFGVIKCLTY